MSSWCFPLFSNPVTLQFSWSEMLLHPWAPPCSVMLDCLESDHHLSPELLQYPLSGFSAPTLSFFQPLFCLHPSARVICLKHRSDQVLLFLQSLMTINRRHLIFEWIGNPNLISGTFLISSPTSTLLTQLLLDTIWVCYSLSLCYAPILHVLALLSPSLPLFSLNILIKFRLLQVEGISHCYQTSVTALIMFWKQVYMCTSIPPEMVSFSSRGWLPFSVEDFAGTRAPCKVLNSAILVWKHPQVNYKSNECGWISMKLYLQTEIWISCHFYMSQLFFFFWLFSPQPLKKSDNYS